MIQKSMKLLKKKPNYKKYITNSNINNFFGEIFDEKLKQGK